MAGDQDERPAEPEISDTAPAGCLFCGAPLSAPSRRGLTKRFCNDRHRAQYRHQQFDLAIRQVSQACEEAGAELARLAARLEGAEQLLIRLQRSDRKSAHPDTKSTKAT